jgi:hypothetical protein
VFDLGTLLTLYPPPYSRSTDPHSLTDEARPRQGGVSAVSAAPAKVLTCPARNTEPELKPEPEDPRKKES